MGDHSDAVVSSNDSLLELLTQLEVRVRNRPFVIDIIASDGRSLALGLGRDRAVLKASRAERRSSILRQHR